MSFSWNIVTDLRGMWQYAFMRNAFEAGTAIALVAGIIGYFVVLRRAAFATHALGHTGFSGAAAAVLFGVNPVYGLLLFTTATGSGIALLGPNADDSDVAIGTVLAFALAMGLLFLSLYTGYATEAYSILFGEVLGISTSGVVFTYEASAIVLLAIALIARPLLFASLDEDVAEAKGLPMMVLSIAFMILLAVTISIAVQIIGVLLIFALMVTPAAGAVRLTRTPLTAIAVSILVALFATWAGLFVAFYEAPPASFFIVTIAFVFYLIVRSVDVLGDSRLLQTKRVPETQALRTLRIASLLGIVAEVLLAVGVVLLLPVFLSNGSVNPAQGAVSSSGWATASVVSAALALIAAGATAGVAAFVVFFFGFRKVRVVEPVLATPTVLVLLGLIGFALALVGEGLLYGGVVSAFGPASGPAAELAAIGGLALLAIGIFLAFLGSIGLALGNWRAGDRYEEETLRVGGLLAFLPVVSVVGFILCSIGYTKADRKIESGWQPAAAKLAS